MRHVIWLVWDQYALLGMYAMRTDAEQRQRDRRAERGIVDEWDPQGLSVRIEPWTVAPASDQGQDRQPGQQHRAILEHLDREWRLLSIVEMGSGHWLHLDTYLVVPFHNRLTCPGFQFDPGRQLWPGLREALGTLRDAGWDEFSITMWFVSHQGSADGDVPALLIRDEPDRVLAAARSTADAW